MKRRFTEEQIIGTLREQEAGGTFKKVTRRHEVSGQSSCCRKAKYGGLEDSAARRTATLADERMCQHMHSSVRCSINHPF